MSGQSSQPQDYRQPADPNAAMGGKVQGEGNQLGPYGGDDGALEHERTEMAEPDTLTPEDTGSKVEPSRKGGQ